MKVYLTGVSGKKTTIMSCEAVWKWFTGETDYTELWRISQPRGKHYRGGELYSDLRNFVEASQMAKLEQLHGFQLWILELTLCLEIVRQSLLEHLAFIITVALESFSAPGQSPDGVISCSAVFVGVLYSIFLASAPKKKVHSRGAASFIRASRRASHGCRATQQESGPVQSGAASVVWCRGFNLFTVLPVSMPVKMRFVDFTCSPAAALTPLDTGILEVLQGDSMQ